MLRNNTAAASSALGFVLCFIRNSPFDSPHTLRGVPGRCWATIVWRGDVSYPNNRVDRKRTHCTSKVRHQTFGLDPTLLFQSAVRNPDHRKQTLETTSEMRSVRELMALIYGCFLAIRANEANAAIRKFRFGLYDPRVKTPCYDHDLGMNKSFLQ